MNSFMAEQEKSKSYGDVLTFETQNSTVKVYLGDLGDIQILEQKTLTDSQTLMQASKALQKQKGPLVLLMDLVDRSSSHFGPKEDLNMTAKKFGLLIKMATISATRWGQLWQSLLGY